MKENTHVLGKIIFHLKPGGPKHLKALRSFHSYAADYDGQSGHLSSILVLVGFQTEMARGEPGFIFIVYLSSISYVPTEHEMG